MAEQYAAGLKGLQPKITFLGPAPSGASFSASLSEVLKTVIPTAEALGDTTGYDILGTLGIKKMGKKSNNEPDNNEL
ncbi:MAG: hypothetical protein A3G30_04810 [Chlamydiae bacterium RIFCSPLOWO2_12_FULL_49_12]|nr:MAG: hypothetical protein A3E26_02375 [Chlamydiae bacterium RIFCSPHIGHO2_12_FULL_49_32]OGN74237.1 MAG: hypothetical protein A3G30_04810 [Chlamydiae bacterium RIFCSPLOWO2_12_FULL_49_12]